MVAAPITQEEQDAEAANGMGQGAGAGAEGGIVPAPGQGNNDANNAAQGRGPYLCTFYGGTLPAPTGEVAKFVNSSATIARLRSNAESCYTFLSEPTSDLRDLNGDHTLFTAMVSVPGTNKVKIIYGMGYGTNLIGQVSPVANKIMALFGEGGRDLGTPQVLVMDSSIRTKVTVKCVTDEVIRTAFTSGITVDKRVAKAIDVMEEKQIMRLAPIPAHLVFDGFNDDLNTSMVYERIMESIVDDTDRSPMLDHALAFLRSCMIGAWRQDDIKPCIPQHDFFGMLPIPARQWANERFQALYPGMPRQQQGLQPQPPMPPAPMFQAPVNPQVPGNQVFQLDAAAIQALFANASLTNTQEAAAGEGTVNTGGVKISDGERARMCNMCGLNEDCGDEAFPKWFRDIFAKNLDTKDKTIILGSAIESSYVFEDAEVPLYPTLLKMILSRDWTGQDVAKRPALATAAKGLSPFAMMEFSEDEVAFMQQEYDDLKHASSVSASDLKAARTKLSAKVPDDAESFLIMIKRYANLLFALFSSQCPLYKQMYSIVTALREYSPNARMQLGANAKAKASILWIILLQSRRFATGKMVGNNGCLGEFNHMMDLLKAKNCGSISHAEVPSELVHGTTQVQHSPKRKIIVPESTPEEVHTKKGKQTDRVDEPFNEALKTLLAQARKDAGYPKTYEICSYCGITEAQLFPFLVQKDCRQFYMTGTCMKGKGCRLNHRTATTEQVQSIKEKLDKFIKEPLGLQGKKWEIRNRN
jgi:hypothetical protein